MIGLSAVTCAGDAASGAVTSWIWQIPAIQDPEALSVSATGRYEAFERAGFRMLEVSGLGMYGVYARYCGDEPGGDGILVERGADLSYGALERAGAPDLANRLLVGGLPTLGRVGVNAIAWETLRQVNGWQ